MQHFNFEDSLICLESGLNTRNSRKADQDDYSSNSPEITREKSKEIDFDLIQRQKDTVEKFLRQISLNESLSRSRSLIDALSESPSVQYSNKCDEEDDEEYIQHLYSLLSPSGDQQKSPLQGLESMEFPTQLERKQFVSRRRRLRTKSKMVAVGKSLKKPDTVRRINAPENEISRESLLDSPQEPSSPINQEHVCLIQKTVRGWLLRRQYLDTKFAVKILQTHMKDFYQGIRVSRED